MKKGIIFLFFAAWFSVMEISGQIADGITYQAVALDEEGKEIAGRDINGRVIHSKQIDVRFSILAGAPDGEILYQEEHSTYTDPFGLFTLIIGHGEVTDQGVYTAVTEIPWGEDKLFLKVEIDIRGGGEYRLMGIQQMMAVPFAFHAFSSSTTKAVNYNDIIDKPVIPARLSDLVNDAGFITGYTETDPVWASALTDYYTRTNMQTSGGAQVHFGNLTNKPVTLAGYGISDAMNVSHVANSITAIKITNWDAAYSWGNHAGLYRLVSWVPSWNQITSNPFLFTSPASNQIIKYNSVSGRWENWTPNYLTSYTETDPVWTTTSGNYYTRTNLQTGGSAQVHFNNITNRPTTLTGYGITDAMNTSHPANAISAASISNWNTAFSWGDHSAANYQPFITAGAVNQYWRGDKTWQVLNNAAVGLGNVENTRLSTWTGSTAIATLGTITSGTWNAGPVTSTGSVTATSFIRSGGTSSQFLKADGSIDANTYMTVLTEVTDEFSAADLQTTFTLSQTPSPGSKVRMYINGIRISNSAYTVTGVVLTYIPSNNGNYDLTVGDRIQFDYSF